MGERNATESSPRKWGCPGQEIRLLGQVCFLFPLRERSNCPLSSPTLPTPYIYLLALIWGWQFIRAAVCLLPPLPVELWYLTP